MRSKCSLPERVCVATVDVRCPNSRRRSLRRGAEHRLHLARDLLIRYLQASRRIDLSLSRARMVLFCTAAL